MGLNHGGAAPAAKVQTTRKEENVRGVEKKREIHPTIEGKGKKRSLFLQHRKDADKTK